MLFEDAAKQTGRQPDQPSGVLALVGRRARQEDRDTNHTPVQQDRHCVSRTEFRSGRRRSLVRMFRRQAGAGHRRIVRGEQPQGEVGDRRRGAGGRAARAGAALGGQHRIPLAGRSGHIGCGRVHDQEEGRVKLEEAADLADDGRRGARCGRSRHRGAREAIEKRDLPLPGPGQALRRGGARRGRERRVVGEAWRRGCVDQVAGGGGRCHGAGRLPGRRSGWRVGLCAGRESTARARSRRGRSCCPGGFRPHACLSCRIVRSSVLRCRLVRHADQSTRPRLRRGCSGAGPDRPCASEDEPWTDRNAGR